jgi:lytic cellulose monooxygenase (C1-hydroxylating)
MSCAQLRISGSGSFTPSQTVSFPGAYQQNDPSILINIYGATGQPDNGGKSYNAPGNVPVIKC